MADYEELTVKDLRDNLSEHLAEVRYGGKRFVIVRHGKPMAELVPTATKKRPSRPKRKA